MYQLLVHTYTIICEMASDRTLTFCVPCILYLYIMIGVWHWFSMALFHFSDVLLYIKLQTIEINIWIVCKSRNAQWARYIREYTDSVCCFYSDIEFIFFYCCLNSTFHSENVCNFLDSIVFKMKMIRINFFLLFSIFISPSLNFLIFVFSLRKHQLISFFMWKFILNRDTKRKCFNTYVVYITYDNGLLVFGEHRKRRSVCSEREWEREWKKFNQFHLFSAKFAGFTWNELAKRV